MPTDDNTKSVAPAIVLTSEEREAFYDTEVAPVLWELATKCGERGISLIASVEWDRERMSDGGWGSTLSADPDELSIAMYMIYAATRAKANFDSFMIAMLRWGKKHGFGNSLIMQRLLKEYDDA